MDVAPGPGDESQRQGAQDFESTDDGPDVYTPAGTLFLPQLPESHTSVYDPAKPKVPKPEVAQTEATEPEIAQLEETEPKPADPQPAEPEVAEPDLATTTSARDLLNAADAERAARRDRAAAEDGRRRRRAAFAGAILAAALVGGSVGAGTVAIADRRDRTVDAGLRITTVNGPPAPALDGTIAAAALRVRPSAVAVSVGIGASASTGSGIIIRSDGYILTSNHVIAAAPGAITVILSDGRAAVAKVIGRDPADDLAVVKVAGLGTLTAATFAASPSVGDAVVAVSAPDGLSGTVSSGIISAVARPVRTEEGSAFSAIQTDLPTQPGGSGAPLADLNGSVVGVVTPTQPAVGGIGFAIGSNEATRIAGELIATGKVVRATIGATASNVSLLDGPGVRLTAVAPAGPAAKGGLKVADVISQVGYLMIISTDGLAAAVAAALPGQRLMVRYTRLNTAATTYVIAGRVTK